VWRLSGAGGLSISEPWRPRTNKKVYRLAIEKLHILIERQNRLFVVKLEDTRSRVKKAALVIALNLD
jgi:hypothetical protein